MVPLGEHLCERQSGQTRHGAVVAAIPPFVVARWQSACIPSAEEDYAKRVKRRCLRRCHGCSYFVGSVRPPAHYGGTLPFLAKCDIFHVGSHRNLPQVVAWSSV